MKRLETFQYPREAGQPLGPQFTGGEVNLLVSHADGRAKRPLNGEPGASHRHVQVDDEAVFVLQNGFDSESPCHTSYVLRHLFSGNSFGFFFPFVHRSAAEVPDLAHGYSTDETARALIAVLKARDHLPGGTGCSKLIKRYLAFLNHALDPANGRFRNLMSYDRRWLEELGSEDSHGRAIWALGEMVARAERKGHTILAVQLFHAALPQVVDFTAPRAWAYCLIGIHAYLRRYSGDTEVKRYRSKLSEKLVKLYERRADDQWLWPEPYLTYENAQLPHALLLCGQWMFDSKMAELALRSLDWLLSRLTADDGHFSPIGNQGWYERGKTKAHFDQQPLEAHATIDACLEAFRMTREPHWHQRAFRIFNWFLGDNDLRAPLYDPNTGGCYDGLHSGGVNENQGAEATVAWLLALTSLYETGAEITETKPPQPEKEAKQVAEPKTLGIRERQTTGQG
mgnify:CR=1 FL=1